MTRIPMICRTVTTFARDGSFDEAAFRQFAARGAESDIGAYLCSGGSGEAHTLLPAELDRIYRVGVDCLKGRVPVWANPPERHTARDTLIETRRAIAAGCEVVNVYAPAGWHGYKPTDSELHAFFDEVLSGIDHPVSLAPNPVIGYSPTARQIAEVVRRHRHVEVIALGGMPMSYFMQLKDALPRKVDLYVTIDGFFETYRMGAKGLVGTEANILPKTFRRFLDAVADNRLDDAVVEYGHISRFGAHVRQWQSNMPRWLKMAMKLLKLPGGEGGPREPYRMPNESEQKRFLAGLLALHIPEIDDLAGSAR